jgi:anti-sigma-K factor RskA
MIDDRLEEQAAMHVLGALSETEAVEFKRKLHADRELQAYVARLSTATGALAGALPRVEPPPQLRAKVLAQVAPEQKIVSLPQRKFNPLSWFPWAVAAGFAALCILLNVQDAHLRTTIGDQAQQLSQLNLLAQSLQSTTNSLQQTVLALQETNRLTNLRIAMLNSLIADEPKAVAVSLWDNQQQHGVFVAQNLKALPGDRDYELWVIDGQKPVPAGVFHLDQAGSIRIDFKPSEVVKTASVFAVTEEVKGGVAAPTVKNMVLAGN